MTSLRDLAELVRLPAALTAPGDVFSGAAAAGALRGWRPAALAASSVCLYWAGMALNDYADRDLDAVERPERPIPSGRVTPATALRLAGGLTATGLALAAASGRRPLATAIPLAGAVWAYDLLAKPTPAGPLVMGSARFLNVLLGASTAPRGRRSGLPAALAVGTHVTAVTALSRGEVHGSSPATARAALSVTAAVTATVAASSLRSGRPPARLAAAGCAAGYAASVGRAQAAAVRSPDAGTVRRATRSGIHGLVPLQAALMAGRGAVAAAAALLAAGPALRAGAKLVSPT
ncbi:SCO3242 family prenyltransferase [Pseudactinotalea sp. HY158]|uniref:SCO3242 family prenyltransferase n=1 Tax=Pseudactinotalea sp. HY158 TaxID=2654547 RepID=UPI00129CEF1E|nr:UbiA family prenyltransferase [Pseudactinotalea sp. HY158]QGH70040.1 4-hydroxybenzoate polyprenyltransferase [Pseudactinotalea sp. HY158]